MYAISSYRGNKPTNTHTQTHAARPPQTGPITISLARSVKINRKLIVTIVLLKPASTGLSHTYITLNTHRFDGHFPGEICLVDPLFFLRYSHTLYPLATSPKFLSTYIPQYKNTKCPPRTTPSLFFDQSSSNLHRFCFISTFDVNDNNTEYVCNVQFKQSSNAPYAVQHSNTTAWRFCSTRTSLPGKI